MVELVGRWYRLELNKSGVFVEPHISWTAETLQNFVPPLSVSETHVNKQLFPSYYKFADAQISYHS